MWKFTVKPLSRQRLATLAERGFVLAFIAIAGTIVYKETEDHTDRLYTTVAAHFEKNWLQRRGDDVPTVVVDNRPVALPDLAPAGGEPAALSQPDDASDTMAPF